MLSSTASYPLRKEGITMTVIERYPDEEFNTELQQEWARAVIEQLMAYSSKHVVYPDVRAERAR